MLKWYQASPHRVLPDTGGGKGLVGPAFVAWLPPPLSTHFRDQRLDSSRRGFGVERYESLSGHASFGLHGTPRTSTATTSRGQPSTAAVAVSTSSVGDRGSGAGSGGGEGNGAQGGVVYGGHRHRLNATTLAALGAVYAAPNCALARVVASAPAVPPASLESSSSSGETFVVGAVGFHEDWAAGSWLPLPGDPACAQGRRLSPAIAQSARS